MNVDIFDILCVCSLDRSFAAFLENGFRHPLAPVDSKTGACRIPIENLGKYMKNSDLGSGGVCQTHLYPNF